MATEALPLSHQQTNRSRQSGSSQAQEKKTGGKKKFRSDIQALRAFAVLAVIGGHFFPDYLPGGYVGVDIFFVISGFLITSILLRELLQYGRIRFINFYARRIRRLLPAASLTIVVSIAAMFMFLPAQVWETNLQEALAAVFYGENIYLMVLARNYHASNQQSSLFQHYWSLCVEEQFYFVWPLLLILAFALVSRWLRKRSATNQEITEKQLRSISSWIGPLIIVVILTVGSFVYGLSFAPEHPTQAYFYTPIRMWEFGFGALTAILVHAAKEQRVQWLPIFRDSTLGAAEFSSRASGREGRGLRNLRLFLSLAGWGLMIASLWLVGLDTVFPGWWAILPVLGASLVIAAGSHVHRAPGQRLWDFYPIRLTGDISYSLYLWHWPLLVLLPYILGTEHQLRYRAALVVVAFGISVLSKFFVEDRGQQWRFWRNSNKRSFIVMILVLLLATIGFFSLRAYSQRVVDLAQKQVLAEASSKCPNPRIDSGEKCADVRVPLKTDVIPPAEQYWLPLVRRAAVNIGAAENDKFSLTQLATAPAQWVKPGEVKDLDFTPTDAETAQRLLLAGDSHAQGYINTVIPLAVQEKLSMEVFAAAGCPLPTVGFAIPNNNADEQLQCVKAGKELDKVLAKNHYRVIVYRAELGLRQMLNTATGEKSDAQLREFYRRRLQSLLAAGDQVIVPTDPPLNSLPLDDPKLRNPACLGQNLQDPSACKLSRAIALPEDQLSRVAKEMEKSAGRTKDGRPRLITVDMSSGFCDQNFCYAAAGGVPFYFDAGHISRSQAFKISPLLLEGVKGKLAEQK